MVTEYPLIENFKHYGLDFLVPKSFTDNEDTDEYYNYEYYNYEHYSDYDSYAYSEEDKEPYDPFDIDESIETLEDLMLLFGCDYMDSKTFLSLSPWELLGIKKGQMKFIDLSAIDLDNFYVFCSVLKSNPLHFESPEKRIHFACVAAATNCHRIHFYSATDDDNRKIKAKQVDDFVRRVASYNDIYKCRVLFSLYEDYLKFYPDAIAMNDRRVIANESPFAYTLNPKPSHLKDLHDKAFRDYRTMDAERAAKREKELNENIHTTSTSPLYRKFLFEDKDFAILPVNNYKELVYEGDYLNHCVASYANEFARADTFIYFLRQKPDVGTPYFTIEVKDEKDEGKFAITQCYTHDDNIDKSEECARFIQKWAKKKNLRIHTEI